jgi:hypothetical protein
MSKVHAEEIGGIPGADRIRDALPLTRIVISSSGSGEDHDKDHDLLVNDMTECDPEFVPETRRSSAGNNLLPSPRRGYHGGAGGSGMAGSSGGSGPSGSRACNKNMGGGPSHHHPHTHHNHPQHALRTNRNSKWSAVRKYVRGETQTFFGLVEGRDELKVCNFSASYLTNSRIQSFFHFIHSQPKSNHSA